MTAVELDKYAHGLTRNKIDLEGMTESVEYAQELLTESGCSIGVLAVEFDLRGDNIPGAYAKMIRDTAQVAATNSNSITVRGLTESDWDEFREIASQAWFDGDSYPFDDSTTSEQFDHYWQSSGEIRVAVNGERVVGGYLIKPNQPWRGSHVANVGYVVDRALRGRGIGRVLVRDSIARAKELGYRGIQFNLVVVSNIGAVRLYESEGFRIIGTVPGIFRVKDGRYVDAHVMHLDLTDSEVGVDV